MTTPIRRLPRNFFDDSPSFIFEGAPCKLIPLTQGQFAIVDAVDYPHLSKHLWMARWSPTGRCYYATRTTPMVNRVPGKIIPMHREVLGLVPGQEEEGDHIETGMTLDNRRANLRIATASQQQHNKRKPTNNTSGFKGVTFEKSRNMYRASIQVNGKRIIIGRRRTAAEASELYKTKAQQLHREFARIT